ncbi:hypothetical protein ACYSNX_01265 [Myroides sp. LJL115]
MEKVNLDFINPVQVISMASRVVASKLQSNDYTKKMNVREFQRKIKDNDFSENLNKILTDDTFKKISDQAIEILSCRKNPLFNGEVPPVLIKSLIKKNQELFLFLIYWLYINDTKELTNELKLKIASKLFIFSWFNFKNEKQLWYEKITNLDFWEEPLNEMLWWNDEFGIQFLITPSLLLQYYNQEHIIKKFKNNDEYRWSLDTNGIGQEIINYYNSIKNKEIEGHICNEYFWKLIQQLQHNRQLLLFAQRDYLNTEFTDFNNLEDLEDTDTPWDLDHIYPQSWVYYQQCNTAIRDWNNTNGNYRALSLEQNRSENNSLSPAERLEPKELRTKSFILDSDFQYWNQISTRINGDEMDNHFKAVTTRMINIYQKIWDDFKLNDLLIIRDKQPKN